MRVTLERLDGKGKIQITELVTLVGRHSSCNLRLDGSSVSSKHLVLVKTPDALAFRDLASTNGTQVNGNNAEKGILLDGDKLSIGGFHFRVNFEIDEGEKPAIPFPEPDRSSEMANEGPRPTVEQNDDFPPLPP